MSKFFESVETQISDVEQNVLAKIQSSTNLRELEDLLSRERTGFGLDHE